MLDFIKNLFNSQPVKRASLPFLHEAINVKSYPISDLLLWQKEGTWDEFLKLILKAQVDRLITGKSITKTFSIMDSSHANGWVLHCNSHKFLDIDYKHLAYLLCKKVQGLGYTINLAEIRSQERSPNVETIVKYYLKPSLRNRFVSEDGLAGQLYGNVTISYKSINGSPFEFKFEAHSYQDSKYTEPLDFSDLLDAVFV